MRVPAFALGLAAAATLAATPLSPASAHDHWGHRGGHGPGLFFPLAIAGAIVGTAAAIATAPVRALADAASAPVYAAPAPAPTYYAAPAPQAYYAPPAQAYYPPPPQAYYPPPAAYYPPPPGYYPPR